MVRVTNGPPLRMIFSTASSLWRRTPVIWNTSGRLSGFSACDFRGGKGDETDDVEPENENDYRGMPGSGRNNISAGVFFSLVLPATTPGKCGSSADGPDLVYSRTYRRQPRGYAGRVGRDGEKPPS